MNSNSSSTWLSVVIPSYNGERWIDAALKSIGLEATDGIEVLLIDGGPNVATRDLARRHRDRLRLRIFERADLPSWQAKTNFGVQQAESTHVCWLGVDDVWLAGRPAAIRSWIDAAPNIALHLAPSAIIDAGGRKMGVWRCPFDADRDLASAFVIERLLIQNFIAAPAPVFRRDAWIACGGADESLWYTADWDMWLKLAALGPVRYHDPVTVGFRVHGSSLTVVGSRLAGDFALQMRLVLDRHLSGAGTEARQVRRTAQASIAINAALASASVGDRSGLLPAAANLLRLGPSGIRRYLRDSRIFERVLPRLRAKLTGSF